MTNTKECPYCNEEIIATAKKCRHCGEWLDRDFAKKWGRGSDEARAVAKGMKEKGLHDAIIGGGGALGIILGGVAAWAASKLGVTGDGLWWVALVTMLLIWLGLAVWYWAE